jgi:hypothetical protein
MPGEEMMAEMEVMEVSPDRLMDLADKADMAEDDAMPEVKGDFSLNRINKLVDSLNRVNKVFRAPAYPKFDKALPTRSFPKKDFCFFSVILLIASSMSSCIFGVSTVAVCTSSATLLTLLLLFSLIGSFLLSHSAHK